MLRLLTLVTLCASAVWADQFRYHSHYRPAASPHHSVPHVQRAPARRPRAPPPGGYASPDAVERATSQFIHEFQHAAAAAEAAPDVDIHTTKDGFPLGSQQSRSTQRVRPAQVQASTAPAVAPGPPAPVTDTPEVAAARQLFLKQYHAEAARPSVAAQPTVPRTQPGYPPSRYYHEEEEDYYPPSYGSRHTAPPPQPEVRLLRDQFGNVIGVEETDEVQEARRLFQAQYSNAVSRAGRPAATAPAAYPVWHEDYYDP